MESERNDVAIVGGGPAGLSAALVLGRARRRVVVVDVGVPRNAPATRMHGFLSRDGMPPADLLSAARAEVQRYGVEIIEDRVVDVTAGFALRLASTRVIEARHVLLTTGAADQLPDVLDARERWGRDLLHCPYCDGWEVRDQPLGVLGTGAGSVEHAHLLRQWTADVILFTHTQPVADAERATLGAAGSGSSMAPSSASSSPTTGCVQWHSPTVAPSRALRSSSVPRCARTATGSPPPSAATSPTESSSGRMPTAARACPASGQPAMPPTRVHR